MAEILYFVINIKKLNTRKKRRRVEISITIFVKYTNFLLK